MKVPNFVFKYSVNIILSAFLIGFILFVSYQILKIIIGGSWETEVAIVAVVLANAGISIALASNLGKIQSEIGTVRAEIGSVKGEIGILRGEIGHLKADFHKSLASFSADIRQEIHSLDKRVERIEHKLKT